MRWTISGFADDVVLASAGDRLWIAASTSTIDREHVVLGRVAADGIGEIEALVIDGWCSRPAACASTSGAIVVGCSGDHVAGLYAGNDGTRARWRIAVEGAPMHVAVAAATDRTWLAVEIAHRGARSVDVMAIDPASGAIASRRRIGGAATWCRWPALVVVAGELVVAWCEGPPRMPGLVMTARGDRSAVVTSASAGDAPALAVDRDGAVTVAWQRGGPASAGDHRDASVVRAIDAAIVGVDGETIAITPPPGAGGDDPRGEDQGWEFPAIAIDDDRTLWLVGRSAHGHHVARRRNEVWSSPASLCTTAWGGRGRRHALAIHEGRVWLARRAPDGIEIGPCPAPSDTVARPVVHRATGDRSPALDPGPRVPGILFGDLHQHTAHSDGCGTVEDLWIAARDRRGLDFAAITDHDQFCRRALGPATWQAMTHVANEFYDPGRFVSLAAYEYTGPRHPGPGHKCVYFGDRVPDQVPGRDLDALFALLGELGAIAVPHHVAWTGGDFAHHDPAIQPVWEICSVHGCYEAAGACPTHPPRGDHVIPGQFVRDALDAGLRFGFIGSTDSHGLDWHHGIARWRNPFRAGLAALVDAEPTRDGVLAALRARRSYATTGARIRLRVDADGAPMGSELPAGTRAEIAIEVHGTAPIAAISVVERSGERRLDISRAGTAATARARMPGDDRTGYIYVRVDQSDGESAWASPFWIG